MSQEITDTDARLRNLLTTSVEKGISNTLDKKMTSIKEDFSLKKAHVVKIYPYLSKAMVKTEGKHVMAKLPHSYSGDFVDLFIPGGVWSYCDTLNETCVIPKTELLCLIQKIFDDNEYLLVSYYYNNSLDYLDLPDEGIRVMNINETSQSYITFDNDGLQVVDKTFNEKSEQIRQSEYVSSDEVYTKDEVDEKISDNGGEIDLSEFYDKNEINGFLNNKVNQSDFQTLSAAVDSLGTSVNGKANSADLSTVAITGSYTDLSNIPSTFAPTSHEHSSDDVKDSNAHSNLSTSANATQTAINTAIDNKIGDLTGHSHTLSDITDLLTATRYKPSLKTSHVEDNNTYFYRVGALVVVKIDFTLKSGISTESGSWIEITSSNISSTYRPKATIYDSIDNMQPTSKKGTITVTSDGAVKVKIANTGIEYVGTMVYVANDVTVT